jgi:hypothetical protein
MERHLDFGIDVVDWEKRVSILPNLAHRRLVEELHHLPEPQTHPTQTNCQMLIRIHIWNWSVEKKRK